MIVVLNDFLPIWLFTVQVFYPRLFAGLQVTAIFKDIPV
jgi:hypothetical protein